MGDGRDFEFPFEVVHAVHKEVWRQLEAVERGEIPHVPTKRILDILRPFVRDSLAAEYDRGYKSAPRYGDTLSVAWWAERLDDNE